MAYGVLQVIRLPILPQFMEIYYHLHTAWGFVQAGGYSNWDFWEYAPVGRPHVYPPVFHIMLALLLKCGAGAVILAKFFEAAMPVFFLAALRYFIRKNYGARLAFFCVLMAGSSFSFYTSLINHLPATLAVIFGLFALDNFLEKKLLRAVILLAICFYTHIGMSWFFATTLLVYALLNKEYRRPGISILGLALVLAAPMIIQEAAVVKFGRALNINERFFCEFKVIDYGLALLGLVILWRRRTVKSSLFLSFLAASLVLLAYPYRFFSAQGYIPILFLSALSLDFLCENRRNRNFAAKPVVAVAAGLVLFFSPTLLFENSNPKMYFFDSALVDLMKPGMNKRPASTSLWAPRIYSETAQLIRQNSGEGDIIFAGLNNVGVCLASMAGRASANGLMPEVPAAKSFDPVRSSKIIVLLMDEDPQKLRLITDKYKLEDAGENKFFIVYKNPSCTAAMTVKKAVVPFGWILCIGLIVLLAFWRGRLQKHIDSKRDL